jgi:sensor histidine kinase YesM
MKKNSRPIFIFWIAYFLFAYFTDLILTPGTTFAGEIIFFTTQNLYLFNSLLFFLRKFSIKTKVDIIKSAFRLLSIVSVFFAVRYFVRYYFLTKFFDPTFSEFPIHEWFISGLLWVVNYFFIASAYFYFQSSIQKQKDLLKSQEEKLTKENEKIQLEKENVQLENAALRAQINPHFLYNTLDFLYAKSLPVSAELSDGVMKLSDIMRYSLKPQDAEGLVYLVDEAEHIQNIIEMNQLRFDNKLNVDFTASIIPDNIKIMPLLLITMVENVFKHGITNSQGFPARIELRVDEQEKLYFSTHNKKRVGPKEHSTGIGLNNTLKRLRNTYGKRCHVSVADQPGEFKVEINIQLNRNKNNYLV